VGSLESDGVSRAESVVQGSSTDHSNRSTTNVALGSIPPSLASLGKKLSGGFSNRNDDNSSLDQNYSGYSKMDTTMGSKKEMFNGDLSLNASLIDDQVRESPAISTSMFKQGSISKLMGLGKSSNSTSPVTLGMKGGAATPARR
jgi:hypothetical protein